MGVQHMLIPPQGKSCKTGQRLTIIEGEDDHVQNRQIEKHQHQNHQYLAKGPFPFLSHVYSSFPP